MTRKDFELIAGVLKDTKAGPDVIIGMAEALTTTNPRFDVQRFVSASLKDLTK